MSHCHCCGDGGRGWIGLDHNFGQRCLVRTADPTIRPLSVGSAVRTNDLAAGAVAGIMTKVGWIGSPQVCRDRHTSSFRQADEGVRLVNLLLVP